jgi:hypothetical protein
VGHGRYVKAVLYANDQVVLAISEDELQKLLCKLNKTAQGSAFKISSKKSKVMLFNRKRPVRSKIVLDNQKL